ncbi:hypothetical protein MJT46_009073 [Ovis ammon polii x Ovis aries]|nr:hypothetical protein MJT46_009073 [Ovis ammon polii x Ovis aries]
MGSQALGRRKKENLQEAVLATPVTTVFLCTVCLKDLGCTGWWSIWLLRLSGEEFTCNAGGLQKTWVQSLGWEDPLRKDMASHFKILFWKSSWTGKPDGIQSMGLQRIGHD